MSRTRFQRTLSVVALAITGCAKTETREADTAATQQYDFRAVGQEPGWHLELYTGKEMRLTYAYGERTAVTPMPAPTTDAASGSQTFHAVTGANDLLVVIERKPCLDAMSGNPFPATVTVTINGETLRGCGGARE